MAEPKSLTSISEIPGRITPLRSVEECVGLMAQISAMMTKEAELSYPLETAAIMWETSASAVQAGALDLRSVTDTLRLHWDDDQALLFDEKRTTTLTSMTESHDAMAPAPTTLRDVVRAITASAKAVGDQVTALNAVVSNYNLVKALSAPENGGYGWSDSKELEWVEKAKTPLYDASTAMQSLADKYNSSGPFLTDAAGQLQWKGPGSGNGAPTANAPGAAPSMPSSPGGPTGADPAAADPGGQEAGAADQAGGAQDAGAGAGAGAGGMDGAGGSGGSGAGSVPEVPGGGTGLAGMPAASTMVPRFEGSLPNVPTVPPTHTPVVPPMSTLPVGGVPGGYAGGAGAGKVPGGGVGGGGLPGVPGGGGSQKGGVDSQLPRAVPETGATQGPLSGGRAPAPATGLAGGTGAATGQGGGGMPPMMPPMAGAAGAGSNKAGRPGNGVIAPGNRRRDRQQGDTPGVPVGLRGRAGKDLPGAFPAVPVNTRRRKEKTEAANTLQLLDEELWKVEATDAKTAPPATRQERHPSN